MPRPDKRYLSLRGDRLARLGFWPDAGARDTATATARTVPLRAVIKRIFDVTVALALLVLLAIPLFLIALAVKLDSRGPVFFRVSRVGFGGRPLTMLKFRKMHDHARGIPLTANADPRLTRVGRILARTRLDELPQLWDVFRGRMSIVGPRPEDPEFVALHADAYRRILSVRPGITGLSQLAFAEEHTILDQTDLVGDYIGRILPQKVGLDTLYAREYGLTMDLKVLGWTAAAMLAGKRVSVHRSTGALTLRRRPRVSAPVANVPVFKVPTAPATVTVISRRDPVASADSPAAEPARAA
jgi:lipopolysaccharide/colanic/teichoic acid biosynthesis glycosyltransferase